MRVPGSPGARERPEASPLGKELISEATPPSGPRTHVLREGDAPPHPRPTLVQGEPHSGGGRASVLLLLLLLRRGGGRFVLNPEAFGEEVDDGTVEVLPEARAVEVMAPVRVDLQRRRE